MHTGGVCSLALYAAGALAVTVADATFIVASSVGVRSFGPETTPVLAAGGGLPFAPLSALGGIFTAHTSSLRWGPRSEITGESRTSRVCSFVSSQPPPSFPDRLFFQTVVTLAANIFLAGRHVQSVFLRET
jgi:hypothetical protein